MCSILTAGDQNVDIRLWYDILLASIHLPLKIETM